MRFGKCKKCGKHGLINMHHILPFFKFEDGETCDLCPNCHAEYHEYLGNDGLHNDSIEFHYIKFLKWMAGIGIIIYYVFFYH